MSTRIATDDLTAADGRAAPPHVRRRPARLHEFPDAEVFTDLVMTPDPLSPDPLSPDPLSPDPLSPVEFVQGHLDELAPILHDGARSS